MYRALGQATGGGAPQPAESTANVRRIAADGQAYTLSQYVEEYGDDAHRFWDEAHDRSILRRTAFDGGGGAPQPAESTAEVRRIAEDGQAYTWPQYVETYGTDAQRCWDDAYGRSMLRRTASDGKAYTWTQCVEQFGDDAQRYWDDASQLVDEETPMLEGAAANHVQAEEPWAIRHQMRGGDDRDLRQARRNACRAPVEGSWRSFGVGILDLGLDSDAPQLARDEATPHENAIQPDGAAARRTPDTPCPTRACPVIPTVASGAETTTAQCLPLPSVCTFQEMQEMRKVKGIGGKMACVKQKELRQECLENGILEIDLTETWLEWRAVLRALPPFQQQLLIGDGIAFFKFRLLQGVRDGNYAKRANDSGERHVFEILRVDRSAVHLHYHKNGTLDDPVVVDPFVMPQNANSGASQPTAPFIAPSPGTASASQPVIGRREAVLALTCLLNTCWQNRAGAVDITDGGGFDWKRFFANTMENPEIDAMDLEKVFALRTADSGPPKLALCTTGTSWKMMETNQVKYKNSRLPGLHVGCTSSTPSPLIGEASDWRTDALFLQAQMAPANWMRLR